jgi:hypothetical protein
MEKWERARGRWRVRGIEKRDGRVKETVEVEVGDEDEEDVVLVEEVQVDEVPGVEDLAGWISEEEGDDSADEWRKVRPTGRSRSRRSQ